MSRWSWASTSAVRRRMSLRSMAPKRRRSLPSITFSATLRLVARLISWCTVLMPSVWAWAGLRTLTGSPRRRISPSTGRCTPVNALINVVLPAPFSPSRAWTSPGSSLIDTASSTRTPGNVTVIPRISTVATPASVTGPGSPLVWVSIVSSRLAYRAGPGVGDDAGPGQLFRSVLPSRQRLDGLLLSERGLLGHHSCRHLLATEHLAGQLHQLWAEQW